MSILQHGRPPRVCRGIQDGSWWSLHVFSLFSLWLHTETGELRTIESDGEPGTTAGVIVAIEGNTNNWYFGFMRESLGLPSISNYIPDSGMSCR